MQDLSISNGFALTQSQQVALNALVDWMKDPNAPPYKTLSGYAGTGKTTLLNYVSEEAKKAGLTLAITATTNKAVKVLRDKIPNGAYFSTVHNLLDIKAKAKGTKELFVPGGKSKLDHYCLVVIDEASMISCVDLPDQPSLLTLIQDQVSVTSGIKILFCGDPAQLQPINEDVSKVFDFSPVKLTEIVRHDDGISNVAGLLRNSSKAYTLKQLTSPPDIIPIMAKDVDKLFSEWKDNPDSIRMLAWRNASVEKWNKALHSVVASASPSQAFLVGDRVIANSLCVQPTQSGYGEVPLMQNSEEGTIISIEETAQAYRMKIKPESGKVVNVQVLKSSYSGKLQAMLRQYANDRKWKQYWATKKSFHDVRLCYSMTVHKSQGSTFDSVIIDYQDIMANYNAENRNQLLYVGITRAAKKVYLL